MRLLADFADRREQSRSLIAKVAIASFLSPDADDVRRRRLPNVSSGSAELVRLERDVGIANEAFAILSASG
jgi:hypothetical protein